MILMVYLLLVPDVVEARAYPSDRCLAAESREAVEAGQCLFASMGLVLLIQKIVKHWKEL